LVGCGHLFGLFKELYFGIICRSMLDIAASHFMAVLAVTTGLSAPYNNLAMIYKQQVLVLLNCFVLPNN